MALGTEIKVAGVWEEVTEPEIKVAGVWEGVTEIELKDAGVWKKVFELSSSEIGGDWGAYPAPPTIAFSITDFEVATSAQVQLAFYSDGTYDRIANSTIGEDWADTAPSTTGADYQIKWDLVTGDTPSNSSGWSENTWLALSLTRSLTLTAIQGQEKLAWVDISIREGTDNNTIVTRRVSLQAESDPGS